MLLVSRCCHSLKRSLVLHQVLLPALQRHLLQEDHHHPQTLHLLHPSQLPLLQADHRPNLLKPEHRPFPPPPDHRHPHHQDHSLHQDFLLNPSTIQITLTQVFSNQSDRKSLSHSQPFPITIQPSLMQIFTPSLMLSMTPTCSLHPTRKSEPSLKLTQVAE